MPQTDWGYCDELNRCTSSNEGLVKLRPAPGHGARAHSGRSACWYVPSMLWLLLQIHENLRAAEKERAPEVASRLAHWGCILVILPAGPQQWVVMVLLQRRGVPSSLRGRRGYADFLGQSGRGLGCQACPADWKAPPSPGYLKHGLFGEEGVGNLQGSNMSQTSA